MHRSEPKVRKKKKKKEGSNVIGPIVIAKEQWRIYINVRKIRACKGRNQNVDHCQSAGTDAIGLKVWSKDKKFC